MGIKNYVKSLGADICGIADLELISEYPTTPPDLLEGFTYGISWGIALTDYVIDGLPKTLPLYGTEYRMVNDRLDVIGYRLVRSINREGYKALAIPASQVLASTDWGSYLSHKAVARASGLGWIGKSALLITEKYGPRVRLATVLTDMPLPSGNPMKGKCGDCTECIEACVVGALVNSSFEDYPKARRDIFDAHKCALKLDENSANPDVGSMICGLCVKVCPWGEGRPKDN